MTEAAVHLELPTGDRKRLALSGGMAADVFKAVTAACDAVDAAAREAAADRAAMESIALAGWTITVGEAHADFVGPPDETINAALRRHGYWVAASRVWRVPLNKGRSLVRSLKRQAGPAATAKRADKAQSDRLSELKRWLGYVEEAAREGRVYERGVSECRARDIVDFADLDARLDAALVQARVVATQVAAERAAGRAAERAQRGKERSARVLFPTQEAPVIGRAYRLGHSVVVYTRTGQTFRVSEDHPSIWGPHLLGREGEPCAYYYYRPATETETAALAATEAAELAAHQVRAARTAAVKATIAAIRQPVNIAPTESRRPTGVIVDGQLTSSGGGTILMLGDDGEAWVIQGNGADGDNWGASNLPGAIGWRTRDAQIIERLRTLIP